MQDTLPQPPRWSPSLAAFASAIEAIITFFYLLSIPADPKNSIFLGYSASRLLLMAAILAAAVICLLLALKFRKDYIKTQQFLIHWVHHPKRFNGIILFSSLLFLLCWTLSWTPPYRMGNFDLEFERVKPLIIWFTLTLGQIILLLLVYRFGIRRKILKTILKQYPDRTQKSLVILAILLFAWGLIIITGLGITPDSSFWNDNAIPVLAIQALLAWGAGFVLLLFPNIRSTYQFSWKIDGLLCLLVWLVAAIIWVAEPQLPSFFAPEPTPPNDSFYPLSDAAEYDMNAQFALIGQGLYNGNHVDKPLYSTLLVALHLLAGQDFDLLAALQAVFLALLPVFLYLTGKLLHSRATGITAALLAIFKGKNAIASSWMILSVNPKLFLSEYPMALGLAILSLLLVLWMTRKNQVVVYSLAIGGVFGLLALIRHNAWLMLPVILILAGIQSNWRWRKWLFSNTLIVLGLFIAIGPWMWRSYQIFHNPWFFMVGLQTEVLQNRYHIDIFTPHTTTNVSETPDPSIEKVVDMIEQAYDPQPQQLWMGKYDDKTSVIRYSENWLHMSDAHSYKQTLSYSIVEGSQVKMNFEGNFVRLFFKSHPSHGKMEVSIDGKSVAIIDQYDPIEKSSQIWESEALAQGTHELVLTHASGKIISLDAIQIESQPRRLLQSDNCSDVVYHWIQANHVVNLYKDPVTFSMPFLFNLDGNLYTKIHFYRDGHLAFGNSITDPNLIESSAILVPFDGKIDLSKGGEIYIDRFLSPPTQTFVIEYRDVPLQDGSGTATYEVVLLEENDNILFQYKNIPENSRASISANPASENQRAFQTISASELKNGITLAFSASPQLCSDSPPAIYEKGFYDDEDISGYDWAWRPSRQQGFGLNNSIHFSFSANSKAHFRFSGRQISLVYQKNSIMTKMKVTLDEQTFLIDQYAKELNLQEVWQSPLLTDGQHDVILEHAGESGEYVGIDAVFIDLDPQTFLSAYNEPIDTENSNLPLDLTSPDSLPDNPASFDSPSETEGDSTSTIQFISAHFVHNLIATFFTLPVSLVNHDIQYTLQNPEGVWSQNWQGQLSPTEGLMVLFNLLVLAIGIGCSWSRLKTGGLVPLITYLTYNLGTAAARTSGGRYIVPVDWVLPLYFAIGLIQVTMWLSPSLKTNITHLPETHTGIGVIFPPFSHRKTSILSTAILLGILLLGASPVLADHAFPQEYQPKEKADLFYDLVADGIIEKMGFDPQQMTAFINDENSFIWQGRALYPRYYHADSGEPAKGPYRIMDFPRIVFTMIGPDTGKAGHAVLPTTIYPDNFPHFSDVIVLGCEDCDANILAVVVHAEEDVLYVRTPPTTLQCPFDNPQCDGDVCK